MINRIDSKSIAAVVAMAWVGALATSGCAAAPANDEEPVATEQELPTSKSDRQGRDHRFSCSKLGCICHGDHDCNTMFEAGVCGEMPAKCFERGPGPHYCICARWIQGSKPPGEATGPSKPPAES